MLLQSASIPRSPVLPLTRQQLPMEGWNTYSSHAGVVSHALQHACDDHHGHLGQATHMKHCKPAPPAFMTHRLCHVGELLLHKSASLLIGVLLPKGSCERAHNRNLLFPPPPKGYVPAGPHPGCATCPVQRVAHHQGGAPRQECCACSCAIAVPDGRARCTLPWMTQGGKGMSIGPRRRSSSMTCSDVRLCPRTAPAAGYVGVASQVHGVKGEAKSLQRSRTGHV